MPSLHYRPDIDGLRAIAILPVIFYHLDIDIFSGGYIGVDVFFVISGFLITSIIYREMQAGHFSVAAFYERRIRRIFPALFGVLILTSAAASILLLPNDLKSYFQSVVAATLFGSNLLFWKTAGYFAWPAAMKPLLHTWSLSIEEQFYIFYPPLLLLTVRFARRFVASVLAGTALLSLAASIHSLHGESPPVFYLLHYRAWELLVGALLAIDCLPELKSGRLRDGLSLLGLALISYAAFRFSDQTVFPGANALYPCLGTAFIIHAGKKRPSFVGKLLSFRPVIFIGLTSYSLYLWHWPLIVLAKYIAVRPLLSVEKLALFGFTFLLATLSWRFIERPFRGKSGVFSRKQLFAVASLAIAVFIAIGLTGHFYKGFPGRLPDDAVALADATVNVGPLSVNCIDPPREKIINGTTCKIGTNSNEKPSFIVWGDSHASAMAEAVHMAALRTGRSGLLYAHSSCPPALDVERYESIEQGCREFNNDTKTWLEKNPNIRTVFLVARWAISAVGTRYGEESGQPVVLSPDGPQGNAKVLRTGLERTLRFLNERGIHAIFVTQVPEVGWNVPSVLARDRLFGHAPTKRGPTLAAYRNRQHEASAIVTALASQYRFSIFDVTPIICPAEICLVEKNGHSLYKDDDHISLYGAALLADALAAAFPPF
jgi:peptidoglycan/LPS O-acetylase OafA/YrhL